MISPMTAEMAIQTAKQLYMLLYGIEVDEEMFIKAVAPEILAPARMENRAIQQILERYEAWDAWKVVAERYEVSSQPAIQLPAPMESQQAGDSASV